MCHFIILREGANCTPIAVQDVVYFDACGAYTNIILINGNVSKQCGNIGEWFEKVKPSGLFVRTNRSHLVNHLQIISFSRAGGVLLKDKKTRLPVSIDGIIELMTIFR
jgi:DNA-binding LytR/AlgR family response regulator